MSSHSFTSRLSWYSCLEMEDISALIAVYFTVSDFTAIVRRKRYSSLR